jgi:DNA-directed RNA polymerase specialized sigma24 family protein
MRRGPWRRDASWTPEEAAQELHRRRPELLGQLRRRGESRGIPPAAQEEIVADAITKVVMSSRPIENERHLIGAFWLAVDLRTRRWREGRHLTRIGSRQRVELDIAVERATASGGPFETVELSDRMARAADFMAQLDPCEQRVVSVMAIYGVGPVPAARMLALPLGEVRAASRSASAKLDQVAVISAAGRMCGYRYRAIAAHAAGEATVSETTAARAHVDACVSCGRVYRQLRREMRGREFQRRASAAFLPLPLLSLGVHPSWAERLGALVNERLPFGGGAAGDVGARGRAVTLLGGGAGAAKAAGVLAGTALVVVGTTSGIRTLEGSHHRRSRASRTQLSHPPPTALAPAMVTEPPRGTALSGRPAGEARTAAIGRGSGGGLSYLGGGAGGTLRDRYTARAASNTRTASAVSLSYLGGDASPSARATASSVAASQRASGASAAGGGQFSP